MNKPRWKELQSKFAYRFIFCLALFFFFFCFLRWCACENVILSPNVADWTSPSKGKHSLLSLPSLLPLSCRPSPALRTNTSVPAEATWRREGRPRAPLHTSVDSHRWERAAKLGQTLGSAHSHTRPRGPRFFRMCSVCLEWPPAPLTTAAARPHRRGK